MRSSLAEKSVYFLWERLILNSTFQGEGQFCKYVNSLALSGCHPHLETLTRMKISAWFHPHYLCFTRITDISPAFCNCRVKKYPPPLPPKKTRKNKNRALFKEKKAPGKTSLYQGSLKNLTALCMMSVYFYFFLCLSIISSLGIVYNRGARFARACFYTSS